MEGELKLDLENVRQCAIDYFIKGDYQGCERLLTFLAKIQPNDENLENFLELSRRKHLESETKTSVVADDQSLSKKVDREQQLFHETRTSRLRRPPYLLRCCRESDGPPLVLPDPPRR